MERRRPPALRKAKGTRTAAPGDADPFPGHVMADAAAAIAVLKASPCVVCRGHLRQVVGDSPSDVRRALGQIVVALSSHGLSTEDCEKAEVVLAEIMNNVVEHSCFGQGSGLFSVEIEILAAGLNVLVEDDGAPMPDLRLPIGHPQNLAVDLHDLPEGGFGWFMIRELAEDLHYEHRKGRNRLTFRLETSS